jgi:hypothetical protein
MTERKTRNKFPGFFWDYFKTNKAIGAQQEKEGKEDEASKSREKAMAILLVVAIIVLIVKSTFLDEVKNLTAEEQIFKNFVDYSVEEEYSGFLLDKGIVTYRVFDLYMANPDEKAILRYEDKETGKMIEITQEGRYNARVRGYLFWVLPIKSFSVTAQIVEETVNE